MWTLWLASEQGEGESPTAGLANLEGEEGQESIGSTEGLTAFDSRTDAQLEQRSKVGIPRQLEIVPLDRCNAAELRDESLCVNPRHAV